MNTETHKKKSHLRDPLPPCAIQRVYRWFLENCTVSSISNLDANDWHDIVATVDDMPSVRMIFLENFLNAYATAAVHPRDFWAGKNEVIEQQCAEMLHELVYRVDSYDMWMSWVKLTNLFAKQLDCDAFHIFSTKKMLQICSRQVPPEAYGRACERMLQIINDWEHNAQPNAYYFVNVGLLIEHILETSSSLAYLQFLKRHSRSQFSHSFWQAVKNKCNGLTRKKQNRVEKVLALFVPKDVCVHVIAPYIACAVGVDLFGK